MLKELIDHKLNENGWELLTPTVGGMSLVQLIKVRCKNGHINEKQLNTLIYGGSCFACRNLRSEFSVYIAELDRTTIKIGITASDRINKRLIELGNKLKLKHVIKCSNKKIALDIERILLNAFRKLDRRMTIDGSHQFVEGSTEYRQTTTHNVMEFIKMLPTKDDIKAIKEKHGLSVSEISRLIYVTENAVYKWLSGHRQMDQAHWELLQYKLEGVEPPKHVWHNKDQGELL